MKLKLNYKPCEQIQEFLKFGKYPCTSRFHVGLDGAIESLRPLDLNLHLESHFCRHRTKIRMKRKVDPRLVSINPLHFIGIITGILIVRPLKGVVLVLRGLHLGNGMDH